jgi:hypothetical protein
MVVAILGELRECLAVDLDTEPKVDRWPSLETAAGANTSCKTFLMVGSSHAGKIGAALARLGHRVVNMYEPNWKIFKNSVALLADKVVQKLKEEKVDCVVFDCAAKFYLIQNSKNSALCCIAWSHDSALCKSK